MTDCDSPKVYARPLIPLLLALMAGIVMGLYLPDLSGVFLAIVFAFLFSLLFAWKGKKLWLLPLFLFFILGYWSLQSWVSPRLSENHVSHFVDGSRWHMIGTIDGDPERFPDRTRLILKAESLARRGLFYTVTGTVGVIIWEPVPGLRSGDRVACFARLKEIRNFNNPGGFDYRRYLAFRGIRASASVSRESLVIRLQPAKKWRLGYAIDRSRQAVSSLIDRATSEEPGEVKGIIKALLIGDRSGVSPEIRDVFIRTGTAHILAISGLHIGIIATIAFFCFRFMLTRSQRVVLAAWPTKGAALLSMIPVLSYGFLAGMSPSTQRAVIMVAVFLMALLLERERDTMNTLALAALVILVINPTALFEISFQLSFTAVFAILYAMESVPLITKLRRGPPELHKRLVLFLLVSTTAILGTAPITLYYFNQMSLIGILTNCFMVPLIGFLVVPMGLLSVVFLPFSATMALWVMKGAAVVLEGGLGLGIFFSEWPFVAVRTVTPTLMEIALYYGLAWGFFNCRKSRRARLVLISLALIVVADVGYWVSERFGRGELRMTQIDIGQGNSTLMELPGGPCVLVDGGGFYRNSFDTGAWVVGPFLWRRKIASVDILVSSHPHPDHLNGLLFIARHFNIREIWINQESTDTEPYRDFMRVLEEKDIRVLAPKDLVVPRIINGVRFEALYPPVDFLERKAQESWRTPNNNSLVLKVTFGDVSFLLPGDIEEEAERELASLACTTLRSDVLLVPHHGSQSSSTYRFLKCVKPEIGIVSSGWRNRYGMPKKKILKRYETLGCRIFRTDRQGAITITTDGKHLSVTPFLPLSSPS
jgi:competence protein ComEC